MHATANPVTNVIAHDGVTISLCVLLHGPTDVPEMFSGATLFDRALETLFRYANQFQPIFIDPANRNCRCSVADKSLERGPTVNRKDVAFFQNVIRRKAMHNLFVDGGADRIWKTVVALERRQSAGVANHLLRGAVDLDRRHTGFDEGAQVRQDESGQTTSSPHLVQFSFWLPYDHLCESACNCGNTLTMSS